MRRHVKVALVLGWMLCMTPNRLVCAQETIQGDSSVEVSPATARELREVIKAQAASWNRADIDGFMDHYWKSPQLTFSSGGKTTRGWQATCDGYKQRYATPEKMGRLTFSDLETFGLSHEAAYVLGRWHLERADPVGGNFSLIMRKIDDRWLIAHDHTSVETNR